MWVEKIRIHLPTLAEDGGWMQKCDWLNEIYPKANKKNEDVNGEYADFKSHIFRYCADIGISWNCTDKSGRRNQQHRGATNWTDVHTVLMQSSETTSRRQICYLNLRDIQWNKCMSNHTRFKWILSKTLGESATSTEKKKCYVLFPPTESWVPKEWSSTRCGTEVAKHSRNSENMMPLTSVDCPVSNMDISPWMGTC